MSPTNLQGLNLVQPSQPSTSYLADSQDSQDLLNLSHFPELSAQLDIWTNLAFESDEPLVNLNDKKSGGDEATLSTHSVEDDEEDDPEDGQPAQADNHDNVVLADPIPPRPTEPRTSPRPLNAFDIGNILAGFGLDPFMLPPVQQPSTATAPTLAQILSLYPQATYPPPPAPASAEHSPQTPAAKRPRVRRSSTTGTNDSSNDADPTPAPATSLTAAEDKRRRNTAASARFRLKKKEREAALEKKSKELETRVTELERECEGLRRENGWLKGLVVGVTGAGATQQQQAVAGTERVKRLREDVDSAGK
jgi:hypothetical protein